MTTPGADTPIWDEEFAGRWDELHPRTDAKPTDAEPTDDTGPTSYDVGPVNPDCQAGKHHVCPGDAWDDEADEPTGCACECHAERPVVDVVEAL